MRFANPHGLAFWLCLCMVGCGYDRPRTQGPGTMRQQQLGATVHDPYFDNDLAPEVVGGRPREFQKPLAEPVRNQTLRDQFGIR